jgi:succinate dehydrogenase / fumarate reductase flavoprotein subunit
VSYQNGLRRSAFDLPGSVFEKAEALETQRFDSLMDRNQSESTGENPFVIHAELGELMLRDCTIERDDNVLESLLGQISELEARTKRIRITDRSLRVNQSAQFVRHLENMMVLARVIATGARRRDECRGSHYKSACDPSPDIAGSGRNDDQWLRTTLARHESDGQRFVDSFSYSSCGTTVAVTDRVDTALLEPRRRDYGKADPTQDGPASFE